MELFFIFIFGLAVGSFLNVLIDRIPRSESIIKARSHCEHCRKTLSWYDMIPVFSFILLNGKCRNCHLSISLYYPVAEVLTGIIFVLAIIFLSSQRFTIYDLRFTNIISIIYYLLILSALIVIFFTDLKYGIIPDKIVFPAIVISFVFLISQYSNISISNFLSAAGAFLFFYLLFIVTRGKGMGFGDVKYVFLMGLILGFPKIVIGLYIAFVSGAIISLILILLKKKKLFGSTVPFGPFLVGGTFIALFYGDLILSKALVFLSI